MAHDSSDIANIRKWLHKLANGLMPVGGKVSLMRLGRIPADDEQLSQLEQTIDKLNTMVSEAREALRNMDNNADVPADRLYEYTCVSRLKANIQNPERLIKRVSEICEDADAKQHLAGLLLITNTHCLARLEGPEQVLKSIINPFVLDESHQQFSILSRSAITALNFSDLKTYNFSTDKNIEVVDTAFSELFASTHEQRTSEQALIAINNLLTRIST